MYSPFTHFNNPHAHPDICNRRNPLLWPFFFRVLHGSRKNNTVVVVPAFDLRAASMTILLLNSALSSLLTPFSDLKGYKSRSNANVHRPRLQRRSDIDSVVSEAISVLTVSALGAVRFGSRLQCAYAAGACSAKLPVLYLTLYSISV
jgi:hypothetical protein